MSLSSEYGKSCSVEISFKDGIYINLRIDIPLELILEFHSYDESGEPIYVEMSKEEQLKEQIPYIQYYLEHWCKRNLDISQVMDINAEYDNYEFYIVQSEPDFKIEAKCNH